MINIAQLRERMPVISSDDTVIGLVASVGTELLVTSLKNGCGFDHLVPFDWIEEVGGSVLLNKNRRFIETHCAHASLDGGCQKAA